MILMVSEKKGTPDESLKRLKELEELERQICELRRHNEALMENVPKMEGFHKMRVSFGHEAREESNFKKSPKQTGSVIVMDEDLSGSMILTVFETEIEAIRSNIRTRSRISMQDSLEEEVGQVSESLRVPEC
jgi:hypothetical protein